MANSSIDGLASGLQTSSIISQLMAIEKQPQTRLSNKIKSTNSLIAVQQAMNTRLAAVKDSAAALARATGWQAMRATSSANDVATVSASSTSLPGSLSFTVNRLAAAHSLVTVGTVTGTAATVVAAGSRIMAGATGGLGISTMQGSAGLAVGSHELVVTQSSAGAVQTGSDLAGSITVAPGATLEVAVDGGLATTNTINLTAGTYTRAQLADMVTSASGGLLTASVSNTGGLKVATTREGSAAQLAITGGTAMATLGLAVSGSASSGTNGIITVDGNATTVTDLTPGGPGVSVLDAGGGESVSVKFSGGIRAGTVTTKNIDLGDGKLSTVLANINAANVGLSASAVQVSPGQFRMQITAASAGVANSIGIDLTKFAGSMGALETLTAAADAEISVGSGASSYKVTSATNNAEIMPGITVSLLKADPAKTVTVNAVTDTAGLAGKVQNLVASVNAAITYITDGSKYDAANKTGGPLMSDSAARQVSQQLYNSFGSATSGTTMNSVGLSIAKDGTLAFDAAKFTEAYQKDPAAVQAFFSENSTTTATDDGLAARIETVAKGATDTVSGLITISINGNKETVARLTSAVEDWDRRLSDKEAQLRKTYSNLESTLGKLQSRSSWLSGQISKLSSSSSG